MFRNNHFKQRIKIKDMQLDNSILVHASSVGEVNAIKPLLQKLIEDNPKKTFVMTCMTKTGIETAKKLNSKLIVYPFPFDVSWIIKSAFSMLSVKMIILVETEIWPNLIHIAYKRKIPVIIANGRISDKSFPGYKATRLFWKGIYRKISLVNAQSDIDAERFKYLGCKTVYNSNNLKFSNNLPKYNESELRKAWRFLFNDFIIAFGSSRPGEEKLIYDIAHQLKEHIPRLKVIIVPRHLYRINEISTLFKREEYTLFSESNKDRMFTIVDEMGILPQVYAISDISIIGGSFFNFGGHNPIEAAVYQKPVVIGPYHYSCLDIVKRFLSNNGIIVSNQETLSQDILRLADDIELRKTLGKNAFEVIEANKDSVELHLSKIQPTINLLK